MADSRMMIDRARVECQNHWFTYDERITVESCAQAVSNLAIQFGDSDDDGAAMVSCQSSILYDKSYGISKKKISGAGSASEERYFGT